MTGLAIAAPLEGNLGMWLRGVPTAQTAPPIPATAVFLDLLGFLGSTQAAEDSVDTGPVVEWAEESPLTPPWGSEIQAAPPQIAAAVIRSMFQPTVLQPAAFQAALFQPVPLQSAAVPPLEGTPEFPSASFRGNEDWDVPLDWIAPEESEIGLEDEEEPVAEIVLNETPVESLALAPTAVVSVPVIQAESLNATPVAAPRPAGGTVQAVTGRASSAARRLPDPAAAPLAFAMRLSNADSAPPDGAKDTIDASTLAPLINSPKVEVQQPCQRDVSSQTLVKGALAANPTRTAGPAGSDAPADRIPQPAVQSVAANPTNTNEQPEAGSADRKPPNGSPNRGRTTRIASDTAELSPLLENTVLAPAIETRKLPTGTERPLETGAPAVAATPTVEAPAAAAPRAATNHEIAVRISSPGTAPVELQVRERGGAVHVAVRTADGALQTALRQDLGVLVNRLEQSGLRTEVVVTPESVSRAETSAETSVDISGALRVNSASQAEPSTSSDGGAPQERGSAGAHEQHSSGRQQNPQRRQNQGRQQQWLQSLLAQGRMEIPV